MARVRLRPTLRPVGAVKAMLETGPMLTLKAALRVLPPEDLSGMVKAAAPWVAVGLMVKVQPSPEASRTIEPILESMPVASPQVMVYVPSVA